MLLTLGLLDHHNLAVLQGGEGLHVTAVRSTLVKLLVQLEYMKFGKKKNYSNT